MRKNVIFLCLALLVTMVILSGCVSPYSLSVPAPTPSTQIEDMTVNVTPSPLPQTVYVSDTVRTNPLVSTQETAYNGVEDSDVNIQLPGHVFGIASNHSAGIDEIRFAIGLASGAAPLDLKKIKIVFSTPIISPITLVHSNTASTTTFTTTLVDNTPVSKMDGNRRVFITFKTAPLKVNTKITIVVKPEVGSSLLFSKTTPATISEINAFF